MKVTPIYKVVTKDIKSAASVFPYWLPEMTIQYETNKWISPNIQGTSIMVFTDLEKVKKFLVSCKGKYTKNWIIFKGEGINVRPKKRIVRINKHICIEKILSVLAGDWCLGMEKAPGRKVWFLCGRYGQID